MRAAVLVLGGVVLPQEVWSSMSGALLQKTLKGMSFSSERRELGAFLDDGMDDDLAVDVLESCSVPQVEAVESCVEANGYSAESFSDDDGAYYGTYYAADDDGGFPAKSLVCVLASSWFATNREPCAALFEKVFEEVDQPTEVRDIADKCEAPLYDLIDCVLEVTCPALNLQCEASADVPSPRGDNNDPKTDSSSSSKKKKQKAAATPLWVPFVAVLSACASAGLVLFLYFRKPNAIQFSPLVTELTTVASDNPLRQEQDIGGPRSAKPLNEALIPDRNNHLQPKGV